MPNTIPDINEYRGYHIYQKAFGAVHIGALHPYQIFIDENKASEIMEVCTYEDTDEHQRR